MRLIFTEQCLMYCDMKTGYDINMEPDLNVLEKNKTIHHESI